MGTQESFLMAPIYRPLLIAVLLMAPLGALLEENGGCIQPSRAMDPVDSPELPPYGHFKGTLPIPFDGQSFEEAHRNLSEHSQFVPVWGRPTPFYDMAEELSGAWGDMFVKDLVRGNGMFPVVHINFYGAGMTLVEPPGMTGSNLSSRDWRKAYHDSALEVLNASRPLYISIGNEVNRWYEAFGSAPGTENSFLDYVSLYNVIYDDIKELSPGTRVFCTFSREIVPENREADLAVLSLFDPERMDLLVFTSYPFCLPGVDDVSDLPDDYYSRAFDHIHEMPVGFSELGWPSEGPFGGEEGQAAYIRNMTSRLTLDQGLDIELLGWAWLTDLEGTDSIGLLNRSGGEKKGFEAWVDNKAPLFLKDNRTISVPEDFGEFVYDLSRTFYDPDPWDRLSYRIWNGSAYTMECTGPLLSARIVNGTLVLGSVQNRTGRPQLRLMAEDWGGLTVWTFFQVTILEVNDPPALLAGLEGLLNLGEDDYRFYDMKEYLVDDQDELEELNMTVRSSPFLVVTADLSISPYMTIHTELPDWSGNTYLHFRVTDTGGLFLESNVSVHVMPENDPPILNLPPYIETQEDTPVSRDISNWVTDADPGDPLYKEAEANDPANVSIRFNGTIMTLVPARDWHGTVVVELTVTDGYELDSSSFTFHVISVNDPPRALSPRHGTMLEDGAFHLDLGSLEPYDPDGDHLLWSVVGFEPPVSSAAVLPNNTLRVETSNNAFGSSNVTLSLEDNAGGRLDLVLSIEVLPVNDPPVIEVPDMWSVTVNRGRSSELVLEGSDYVLEDPDDAAASLSIVTDSEHCRVKGPVINITVPSDLPLDRFSVIVRLKDPHGAFSEGRELIVIVLNGSGPPPHRLRVAETSYDMERGRLTFEVRGDPGQNMWVVLRTSNEDPVSFMLEETPAGSGRYIATITDPPFKDGTEVSYHLSLTENGPNDSMIPASTFRYSKEADEGAFEGANVLLLAIIAISLVVLVLLGCYLFMRKDREAGIVHVSDPFEE